MSFVMKRVGTLDSLGADVRELRERAGLTVEGAAEVTRVLPSVIKAWEADAWESRALDVLEKRLFLAYVKRFGGRESYFSNKFDLLTAGSEAKTHVSIATKTRFSWWDPAMRARLQVAFALALFVASIGGYVYAQTSGVTSAPVLELSAPNNGTLLKEPTVQVEGKTVPEAVVWVNDQRVPVQPDGHFSLKIDVPQGTTQIQVKAQRRHGDISEVDRFVIFDRESLQGMEL